MSRMNTTIRIDVPHSATLGQIRDDLDAAARDLLPNATFRVRSTPGDRPFESEQTYIEISGTKKSPEVIAYAAEDIIAGAAVVVDINGKLRMRR